MDLRVRQVTLHNEWALSNQLKAWIEDTLISPELAGVLQQMTIRLEL